MSVLFMGNERKFLKKIPWFFVGIRLPKINYPSFEDKSLDIPTPGRNIFLVILYGVLFFLLCGGVYLNIPDSLGRVPIALGSQSGNPLWVYPSINDAFVIESFIAAVVIFIGAIGFMVLYSATKNLYNPSYAQKLIFLGLILAGFAFVFLQFIIVNLKADFLLN